MLTAADVMTTKVVSVTPQTPVRDIAKLMCTKRISGVPVIDEQKRVIGIVSEGDLIRHADVIGEQRRPWWLTTFTSATTQVRNGVVDLSGFVESEDERHAWHVAVE